ncbi:DAK2 domain-containing protein [Candidatus Phytoplasma solani]|uniref:DAK2 domain-containing protein n=1 Tax=Candidatus Phytoplasma solani TaxID=69896 RepID=UPI0003B7D9E8|nr:DAK2 domain-containing protein [Candidatus Phytoplasma solani]CCP88012.1 predicted glycerone kinase [Candidatus Phytoplasma solani]
MHKNEIITNIDGILFKNMIINGAINLQNNYHKIDNLNVFPVPDRDTGTNMKITMMSGVASIKDLQSNSIVEVSQVLSKALLMGAKGNSGVILSQFFAGMADNFIKLQKSSINLEEFIQSLQSGYQKAYRSIIKPTEGTILTVFRESVNKTIQQKDEFRSVVDVVESFLTNAQATLAQTTNLLPVLKKAGVVDSGGAGFVEILKGVLYFLKEDQMIEMQDLSLQTQAAAYHIHNLGQVNIKYIYCTEYVFKLKNIQNLDLDKLKSYLLTKGDSLVLAQDQEILKIHIHTNKPGAILEKLLENGDLQVSKIDNMKEQHQKIINENQVADDKTIVSQVMTSKKNQYSLIVFAQDAKIKKLLVDFKIDHIINPSYFVKEELLQLIAKIDALHIIILPNNLEIFNDLTKSIIPANPEQKIIILPTKNIAQTYSALLSFDQSLDWNQNQEIIEKNIKNIQTGEIIATNPSTKNQSQNIAIDITKQSYLSICEGKIIATKPNKYEAISALLKKMIKPYQSFLTIFYNASLADTDELAKIEQYLEKNYDHLELEIIENAHGSAPYIVSLE